MLRFNLLRPFVLHIWRSIASGFCFFHSKFRALFSGLLLYSAGNTVIQGVRDTYSTPTGWVLVAVGLLGVAPCLLSIASFQRLALTDTERFRLPVRLGPREAILITAIFWCLFCIAAIWAVLNVILVSSAAWALKYFHLYDVQRMPDGALRYDVPYLMEYGRLIAVISAVFIALRLMLFMPATFDSGRMNVWRSWALTKSHVIRLAITAVFSAFIISMAAFALTSAFYPLADRLASMVYGAPELADHNYPAGLAGHVRILSDAHIGFTLVTNQLWTGIVNGAGWAIFIGTLTYIYREAHDQMPTNGSAGLVGD